MPLYEYECPQCGRFELIQKFSDEPLRACPTCGREVQKLLSAPAIQFKGAGWYITDYARKGQGEGKKDGGGADSGKSESAESKSDPKSESKSESKSETSKAESTPTTGTSK